MSAIVNDLLNVSSLSQAAASSNNRVPVTVTTTLDLNASGLSSTNCYYIMNPGASVAVTFPVNYAANRGRVLHFLNIANFAITVPASGASSGVAKNLTTGNYNGGNLLPAVGATTTGVWVSLVCDGTSGWLAFASS